MNNPKAHVQAQEKEKEIYIISHMGLGDNITHYGAVSFCSLFYDKVNVVVLERNYINMVLYYSNIPNVCIVKIKDNDEFNQINLIYDMCKLNNIDVLSSGYYSTKTPSILTNISFINSRNIFNKKLDLSSDGEKDKEDNYKYTNTTFNRKLINSNSTKISSYMPIPAHIINFYNHMGLSLECYHNYHHIMETRESTLLYNLIKEFKIVFTHLQASNNKHKFDLDKYISDDSYIVISANENLYNLKNNSYKYDLASHFINIPIIYYIDTILGAEQIYMIDSCFSCIVYALQNRLNNCYIELFTR